MRQAVRSASASNAPLALYFALLPDALRRMVDRYLAPPEEWRTCGDLTRLALPPLPDGFAGLGLFDVAAFHATHEPVLIRVLGSLNFGCETQVLRYWLPMSDARFLVQVAGFLAGVISMSPSVCVCARVE